MFFNIARNGNTATVAENITFDPANSEYYYTFAVANTTAGGGKIDGFFIGVGKQADALAVAQTAGAGAAGGADGAFPAGTGGPFPVGGTALLDGVAIAGTPLVAGGTAWGFEDFENLARSA